MLTGVDRVELAYLRHLAREPVPLFTIARSSLGFILLGPDANAALLARITGAQGWGKADRLSRLSRSKSGPVQQAESDLRRLSLARCRPRGLARMLARHLPQGSAYLNTGHSNFSQRMTDAVKTGLNGRVAVFLHDTIPLDFPQYQRPETLPRFAGLMKRAQTQADLILCNSAATRDDLKRHFQADLPVPPIAVAHLGLDLADPDPGALPPGLPLDGPYFVAVGTIEPRKRHDLLLDVWDALPDPSGAPLFLCGARGWRNADVFARLDRYGPDARVRELPGLSDGAMAALVQNATALLFPSDAEGYGLPAMEAAALGTPVVCQHLPVFNECLGDIPVYAPVTDRYSWQHIIERLIQQHKSGVRAVQRQSYDPPNWADHFKIVLRLV